MKKNLLIAILFLTLMLGWQTARADHPREGRVEIWTAQYDDDHYRDEAREEVFFRLHERGYVTVYQIDPYGRVQVLYPLAHHGQYELRPHREYRLSDLAEDVYLHGEEGYAQIGVIFTREPVAVAPWLERSFFEAGLVIGKNDFVYARFDFPRICARVEADIRIRLGTRCTPSIVVAPVYVRPRVIYCEPDYRHRKPHPHWRKHDHCERNYERPYSRGERLPAAPARRDFERRGPEERRVTAPASDRNQTLIVNDSAPHSRRERRPESKKLASNHEEKRSFSRRSRETRSDD